MFHNAKGRVSDILYMKKRPRGGMGRVPIRVHSMERSNEFHGKKHKARICKCDKQSYVKRRAAQIR